MATRTMERVGGPSWTTVNGQPGDRTARRSRAYGVLSDEALVLRARNRDHAAFDALVARHGDRLYTLALTSLEDEKRASDALCDMLLSAFRDIDSSQATTTPRTWLYLHGVLAVLAQMEVPPGTCTIGNRRAAGETSRSAG